MNLMKLNKKDIYCSPEFEVFEIKPEGVICNSQTLQDYTWNDYQEE